MMLRCHGQGCKPPLTASHIHIGCIQRVLTSYDAVDGHLGQNRTKNSEARMTAAHAVKDRMNALVMWEDTSF